MTNARGGGNSGNTGDSNDAGERSSGGKGAEHYSGVLGGSPQDPKDPDVTFDRKVDPETGEVTWTQREMRPGEAQAIDGRDVERIPRGADRVVVTMVDGEPRITYQRADEADGGVDGRERESNGRVVAGSGAIEPTGTSPDGQWSRRLSADADYAVVEIRDGQTHLVFLDTDGKGVGELGDVVLPVQEPSQPLEFAAHSATSKEV